MAAKKILAAYPDYGKAPPEYLLGFIEAMSFLKADEVEALMHPLTGLASRCKFLPTVADVMDFLNERKAKAEQFIPPHSHYERFNDDSPEATREKARLNQEARQRKFSPFPKLTEAFRDKPALMVRTFDCLCDASKALAMHGKQAAHDILKAGKSI